MKNYLAVVWGIFLMGSCQPKSQNGTSKIPAVHISGDQESDFDQITTAVSFIPLLIPEEEPMFISDFDPAIAIGDFIFIAPDNYGAKDIYQFGLDGSFIQRFNQAGGGPGEYQSIENLILHQGRLIVGSGSGTFHFYDQESLTYLETITPQQRYLPSSMILEDGNWLFGLDIEEEISSGYFSAFNYWDAKQNQLMDLGLKAPLLATNLVESSIAKNSDQVYLNFGASDTIYTFQDQSVMPLFALDFRGNGLPETRKKELDENAFESIMMDQKFAFNIGSILATNEHILLIAYGLYKSEVDENDLSTFPLSQVFVSTDRFKPKVLRGLFANYNSITSDGTYFYVLLKPEEWQRLMEENYFGLFSGLLENAAQSLKDEEDPIMLRFKIKSD